MTGRDFVSVAVRFGDRPLPMLAVLQNDDWAVRLRVADVNGDAAVQELVVAPVTHLGELLESLDLEQHWLTSGQLPSPGLTARALRELPLGALLALAQEHVQAHSTAVARPSRDDLEGVAISELKGDVLLAYTAQRYLELLTEGAGAAQKAAEEFGIRPAALNSRLARARSRGLLTSVGRGKRGGTLTSRAWSLLNSYQEAGLADG
ncbi:hypothetical protein EV189_1656 [Motilibacter rhizosphaerae]|uniref:Uncharacterized protein n=1 Tax=Motilibacter rhizosphaerae TaxID=598652 RepID=A0A4V2F4M9_9ACTN|nr:hypothetical protein [Motilibacter rhizosphaerae]RZS89879.1 hypothetical protein EV189_1656 [Motilibacter rhizosphaerae]